MSKSKGNGIDPLDWVQRFGADALSPWRVELKPGADISVGEDHASSSRNFATKLYNATKFALMNGARVGDLPERESLTRWTGSGPARPGGRRRPTPVRRPTSSPRREALYHFPRDEFCDWHLELTKVRFAENDVERSHATSLVLGHVLDKLLHTVAGDAVSSPRCCGSR